MRLLSTSVAALLFLGGGQAAFAAAPNPVKPYSLYKGVTLRWTAIANPKSYTVCYATAAFAATSCPNPITLSSTTIARTVFKLVNGTTYYFRVKATNTSNVTVVSNQVTSVPRAGKLNDTGITTCSNATQNGLPCPVTGFPGQDAQYGRDKAFPSNSDGHAGFSFTKISATGAALPASATSWNCVKDNVTGLMWEVKTNDGGLHDKDNIYSWYNPDPNTNGGDPGKQNGGLLCVGSSCDTDAYVKTVNATGWCGYKDWRLPNVDELISITDLSPVPPAIDTAYFPNTVNYWFWSSSSNAALSSSAWFVAFYDGFSGSGAPKDGGNYVRLVRSGQ